MSNTDPFFADIYLYEFNAMAEYHFSSSRQRDVIISNDDDDDDDDDGDNNNNNRMVSAAERFTFHRHRCNTQCIKCFFFFGT